MHPDQLDIEKSLLSRLLQAPSEALQAIRTVEPAHFVEAKHQILYRAIRDVAYSGTEPIYARVEEHLVARGELQEAGGPEYLQELRNRLTGGFHWNCYSSRLQTRRLQRGLVSASEMIARAATEEQITPADVLRTIGRAFNEVTREAGGESQPQRIKNWIWDLMEATGATSAGRTLGEQPLDTVTGSWDGGALHLVLGGAATGKTALALRVAADRGTSRDTAALYISLSERAKMLIIRLLAAESGTPTRDIVHIRKTGWPDEETVKRLAQAAGLFTVSNLHFSDGIPPIPGAVIAAIAAAREDPAPSLVVIDGAERLWEPRAGHADEVSAEHVLARLAAVARETGAAIVAVARADRAEATDPRDPTGIAQGFAHADTVLLLEAVDADCADAPKRSTTRIRAESLLNRNYGGGTCTLTLNQLTGKLTEEA